MQPICSSSWRKTHQIFSLWIRAFETFWVEINIVVARKINTISGKKFTISVIFQWANIYIYIYIYIYIDPGFFCWCIEDVSRLSENPKRYSCRLDSLQNTHLLFPFKKAANQEVFLQIEDTRIKLVCLVDGYVNVKVKLKPHPLQMLIMLLAIFLI